MKAIMSVTTSNFQYPTLKWREKGDPNNLIMTNNGPDIISSTVDDGLTSLSWLQNLNMCMTRLGAPTPPTPPASPLCFGINYAASSNRKTNSAPNPPICGSKCKGAIPSSGNVESVNCSPTSATRTRNGYTAPLQNEPQAQSTVGHKSEASKKKASSSQAKQQTGSKASKKRAPQYSPHQQPQPSLDVVDYKSNGSIKPPYSYATLICMAMKANKNKMTLSSIYKWIKENFLYYRNADPSWQNSIRHNLSLNKCFIKIPRNKDEPGKGGFWKLDPIYADSLVDGVFKKRRPNHKGNQYEDGSETNGEIKLSKKKSRKKNSSTESANYIEIIKVQQETPPSSTESYNYKEMTDAGELVTAVNSIENGCAYSYTLHSANLVDCEQNANLVHGYATEVCIANSANGECIIESDGNDICWNAILTEADLNELVDPISYTSDSVAQIIHPIESDITNSASHSKTTTAQLTAVEPHDLDMVASSTNMLEDQQLFYPPNQLHSISFETNTGNVITATSNVVTCINDTMVGHWNSWNYQHNSSVRIECPANHRNAELILSQIEHGHDQIMHSVNGNAPIAYVTNGSALLPANSASSIISKHIPAPSIVIEPTISSHSMEANSPSPANFELPATSMPPWECKAAIEAAALDLDSFSTMEPIQQF